MIQMTRRTVIKSGLKLGAASLLTLSGLGASGWTHSANAVSSSKSAPAGLGIKRLVAKPSHHALQPNGPKNELWTYGDSLPGPEIRVRQGEKVQVLFENKLPQATSVHWHGIRIDNAMDGVSGLTQAAVPPGETYAYEFTVPDAGTYWYHPHNRSWEQLARGLYGPLIIEEKEPYPVDLDQVLVIDDWRLDQNGQFDAASLGNGHDWSHAGRLGNWATVNGKSDPVYQIGQGQRVRLRLINTANARVIPITLTSLEATLIALDGQPLANPQPIAAGEGIPLAPAQRADIVVDITTGSELAVLSGDERFSIARFEPTESGTSSGFAGTPVPPLPTNDLPLPDLQNASVVPMVMTGGAMRWLGEATYKGKTMDGRALAAERQFWGFNGQVGRTDVPLVDVSKGQTVVIDIKNETGWPHAMHVHGHHFLDVTDGQVNPDQQPWRDTILLERGQAKKIAFVADNVGKWMFHCHMLEHQAGGMATWFNVS